MLPKEAISVTLEDSIGSLGVLVIDRKHWWLRRRRFCGGRLWLFWVRSKGYGEGFVWFAAEERRWGWNRSIGWENASGSYGGERGLTEVVLCVSGSHRKLTVVVGYRRSVGCVGGCGGALWWWRRRVKGNRRGESRTKTEEVSRLSLAASSVELETKGIWAMELKKVSSGHFRGCFERYFNERKVVRRWLGGGFVYRRRRMRRRRARLPWRLGVLSLTAWCCGDVGDLLVRLGCGRDGKWRRGTVIF